MKFEIRKPVTKDAGRASPLARKGLGHTTRKVSDPEDDIRDLFNSSVAKNQQGRVYGKILHIFSCFLDNHPQDGKLNKKDFSELLSGKVMEDHIFRVCDTDNDGYIDLEEFMSLYHLMSNGESPMSEILAKIFRVFDVNSDGTVSKKEMNRVVKDLYRSMSTDEKTKEKIADKAFEDIDENEDGEISLEEFTKACLTGDNFTKHMAVKIIGLFVDRYTVLDRSC